MAALLPGELGQLRNKFLALQMRFSTLHGRHSELKAQQSRLVRSISLAKARIELAPLATETFNYLQEKAHSRAVGEFEELLSAFVADVIPEAGSIRLELGTERGAPALNIKLDNAGNLEDILDGNGGGLTNVVVAALTYAAQARANTRALIVLDEPDCWMASTRVARFTKVIAEVANPTVNPDGTQTGGCQTLMISHNKTSLIDPSAHIITLANEDGVPIVESSVGARPWADTSQEGVRWIEVENYRAHLLTRIVLCPGLNLVAGDINVGKSTLVTSALRALAYGDVDDSIVRHGQNFAKVRVGLENDVVLEVVRFKKTAGLKTLFRRYRGAELLHEGPMEHRTVPGFISEILRIERVDDLDIQLRSQKQPVFLLNEPASRRARLLSVGREAGLLQSLIEKHRLELKRDKEAVKREEVELNTVNRSLTVLGPLSGMDALVGVLTTLLEDVQSSAQSSHSLSGLIQQLEPLMGMTALLTLEGSTLARELPVPSLTHLGGLTKLVAQLESNSDLALLPDLTDAPNVPELNSNQQLVTLISAISKGAHAQSTLLLLPEPPVEPNLQSAVKLDQLLTALRAGRHAESGLSLLPAGPVIPDLILTTGLSLIVENLSTQAKAGQELVTSEKLLAQETSQAEQNLNRLMHELGVCPVCSSPFKNEEENV